MEGPRFILLHDMCEFLILPMRGESFAHITFQKICLRIAPVNAKTWARISQSVQRLAADWTARGSNPGWGKFSAALHAGPGSHSVPYKMGTGCLAGGPEGDVDFPP